MRRTLLWSLLVAGVGALGAAVYALATGWPTSDTVATVALACVALLPMLARVLWLEARRDS